MSRSAQEIQDWIVEWVSALTGVPPQELDVREPLLRYGLNLVVLSVTKSSNFFLGLGGIFSLQAMAANQLA